MKKFVRRATALAMGFTLSFALFSPVSAAENELRFPIGSTNYTLNGAARPAMPVAPFVSDAGRTMLPARFVAEAMGSEVDWDSSTRSVLIDGRSMFTIGEAIYVGGDYMGTPVIVDDRTFVPFRFLAESLGGTVRWDGDNRVAYITFSGEPGAATTPTTTPTPTPPATEERSIYAAEPSGNVGRLTLGTNWATAEIIHNFTDGQYTISLYYRGDGLSIGPAADPWYFRGNALAADYSGNTWHSFTASFDGSQTFNAETGLRGIQIGPSYDETEVNGEPIGRKVGSTFYVDNILITNAAGNVVFEADFESGTHGITAAVWSESTFTTVPMP
jgi:hypothetical protein